MQSLTDAAVLVFFLALAALVGAGVGAYLALAPAGNQIIHRVDDIHSHAEELSATIEEKAAEAAEALAKIEPVIEVQPPHVEWPPILTWLFVVQTVLIFVLVVSNIVDLRKLSRFYYVFTTWLKGKRRKGRTRRKTQA